ncbi:MAG: hypothetical protein AAF567_19060 [Actinomycetota bacterium]
MKLSDPSLLDLCVTRRAWLLEAASRGGAIAPEGFNPALAAEQVVLNGLDESTWDFASVTDWALVEAAPNAFDKRDSDGYRYYWRDRLSVEHAVEVIGAAVLTVVELGLRGFPSMADAVAPHATIWVGLDRAQRAPLGPPKNWARVPRAPRT